MSDKTHRTHSTILGQHLWSPRFGKKGEVKEWQQVVRDARKNIRDGKELSARQRQVLQSAGFEFQTYEGDIFVNDLAARFLKWRAAEYVSSTALPNFDHLRKYILPEIGHRNVYGLGPSELRRLLKNLKQKKYLGRDKETDEHRYEATDLPLSHNTIQKIKITLSLLFDYAIEEDLVGDNFVNPIKKGRRRQGSRKATTDEKFKYWESVEDISAFLKAAQERDLMFYALATLTVNTGARKSEVLALRYDDFDFKNERLFINRMLEQNSLSVVSRTKSGEDKTRVVPLNEATQSAVTLWKKKSPHSGSGDYVFSRANGEPFGPRQLNDIFTEVTKTADVENIGPHGLRHTYATHYIINGGRVEDLKELLGHSSITTTMKYVHMVKKNLKSKDRIVSFSSKGPSHDTV